MIIIILGTRPEIIKLFPIIEIFSKKKMPFKIIHTGQHYSSRLSDTFIKQLKFPINKIINLKVGSGNHGDQTALMISRIEKYLRKNKNIKGVIVYGDTNSALAGSLAASKISNIKLIHLEAGLRSFDKAMPEESKKIFVTGNTISDAIKSKLTQNFLNLKKIYSENYIVLTIHREENTRNTNNLKKILFAMSKIAKKKTI